MALKINKLILQILKINLIFLNFIHSTDYICISIIILNKGYLRLWWSWTYTGKRYFYPIFKKNSLSIYWQLQLENSIWIIWTFSLNHYGHSLEFKKNYYSLWPNLLNVLLTTAFLRCSVPAPLPLLLGISKSQMSSL